VNIVTYIAKILEKYYENTISIKQTNRTTKIKYKINKSNLVNGILDNLFNKILRNELTENLVNVFCKSYIKVIGNREGRTFPRTAKTPFTKWYIKGYSDQTKYLSIFNALLNDTVEELNKNLKTIARRIISIDNVKYNE
jgi:hypothetical protein